VQHSVAPECVALRACRCGSGLGADRRGQLAQSFHRTTAPKPSPSPGYWCRLGRGRRLAERRCGIGVWPTARGFTRRLRRLGYPRFGGGSVQSLEELPIIGDGTMSMSLPSVPIESGGRNRKARTFLKFSQHFHWDPRCAKVLRMNSASCWS
jgi:hypothetical protein